MQTKTAPKNNTQAIMIIGLLFFVFGFITWLNSTLIPFLKIVCQLRSDIQAFLVTTAFYMAYFFLALPSAAILKRTGFKKGMSLGLVIMAAGSLLFIPAATGRSFPLFLTGLFVQGMGLALLQTASNPYITILGPMESAARRISIMGVCNKTAGILSPLILSAFILTAATELEEKLKGNVGTEQKQLLLQELSQRVITPYIFIAVILAVLGVLIWFSPLPEIDEEALEKKPETESFPGSFHPAPARLSAEGLPGAARGFRVVDFPNLGFGIVCLIVYVGVEVLAGDGIGTYGRTEGLPLSVTRYFPSFTLGFMLLGYIIGVLTIPKYLSQRRALTISAVMGIVFAFGALFNGGYVSIAFVALLGLANALMWPAIWPLAIDGLGRYTKTASALLIMGLAGGALIPLCYPTLHDKGHMSNGMAFFTCTFPCYLYILFYALRGYQTKKSLRLGAA